MTVPRPSDRAVKPGSAPRWRSPRMPQASGCCPPVSGATGSTGGHLDAADNTRLERIPLTGRGSVPYRKSLKLWRLHADKKGKDRDDARFSGRI